MHTALALLAGPLFEHSPHAILIADTNGVVRDVNAEFTRLTGYAREEIVGKTPRLLKSGQMPLEFYRTLWQTVLSGQRWRNDILNRRKDGSLYWADEIIQPITLDGETVLVSFQRDVTELRRMREALDEERARLDGFLRASPAVLYAVPATGTTQPLFVSENVKDLLGNLPVEPCSDPHWWLERIHPEDRDAVQRTLDFRRWPGDTLLRRYRLRHADGHYVWVEDKVTLVRDGQGRPQFLSGALLDVSREAEQRALLDKLARHLPGVIYIFKRTPDDHMSFPYASEGMRRICGIDPEAVREDATPFFASVHPEDQAAMRETSDHSVATLEPWRLLYRHVHPDGRIVWAEGEATPERQPDGSTLWYGFIADVTARVEAERKLREQEVLYHTVLDNLQEICYVAEVTPEGFRFRTGNAKLYELFGFPPERWIGASPRELFPPQTAEHIEKNLRRSLEEGRTLRTETAMATAHGWREFSASITPPVRRKRPGTLPRRPGDGRHRVQARHPLGPGSLDARRRAGADPEDAARCRRRRHFRHRHGRCDRLLEPRGRAHPRLPRQRSPRARRPSDDPRSAPRRHAPSAPGMPRAPCHAGKQNHRTEGKLLPPP